MSEVRREMFKTMEQVKEDDEVEERRNIALITDPTWSSSGSGREGQTRTREIRRVLHLHLPSVQGVHGSFNIVK